MKILFLSSEVAPFSKTGGLADVSAALPAALASRGHEVLVATPHYGTIQNDLIRPAHLGFRLKFPFGEVSAQLSTAQMSERYRVMFIDQPEFFHRAGIYQDAHGAYLDNPQRFAFFSMAALSGAQAMGFAPDILHVNDWQGALAALALRRGYAGTNLNQTKTVFTIHNLAYQGSFPRSVVNDLGIPWDLFAPDGLEFYGTVNFLKAGLVFSDALTTVSPRYASEIQTVEGGCGLDGVLRHRSHVLHGILNGVDYADWNPENDVHLPAHFSAKDFKGKDVCRKTLLEQVGLKTLKGTAPKGPIYGVVSRLVDQKGIDLLLETIPRLMSRDASLVVLGTGEAHYEQALVELAKQFPTKMSVRIGFDNALTHLIEAGSDFFLMPSRYEPCGLNQMYSLAYGTVPIVRATGGLDDTVVDLESPEGTGIKFWPNTADAFWNAIERSMTLFADSKQLNDVRVRGMKREFSWTRSAQKYEALYSQLTGIPVDPGSDASTG